MTTKIRQMKRDDLPAIIDIQKQVFGKDLCETLEVFTNRFELFGDYFKVATINDKAVGYMICFPYKLGEIPKNNKPFPSDLPAADCFYLHDIALLPESRGHGLAQALIEQAATSAKKLNFNQLLLVSVPQAGSFWDKQGFNEMNLENSELNKVLKSYGENSRLMTKKTME